MILCDICSQAFHYKCVNETKTNVASDYWWCCPECCVMNLNANLLRAQQVVVRTGDAKTKYVAYGETLFMQKYDETEEGAAEGGDTQGAVNGEDGARQAAAAEGGAEVEADAAGSGIFRSPREGCLPMVEQRRLSAGTVALL